MKLIFKKYSFVYFINQHVLLLFVIKFDQDWFVVFSQIFNNTQKSPGTGAQIITRLSAASELICKKQPSNSFNHSIKYCTATKNYFEIYYLLSLLSFEHHSLG